MDHCCVTLLIVATAVAYLSMSPARARAETLHNGIVLPSPWPPATKPLTEEPLPTPPYLVSPPPVIPIDVGRQLLVDDFLVEQSTLQRTWHTARYHPGNPLLKPDQPWEQQGGDPTAMVFSDGVWYDPADRLFKMWYAARYEKGTAYAVSRDGLHWEKPALDAVPGTNLVHPRNRDSSTVWLDLEEKDPARRYKLFIYPYPEGAGAVEVYFSADGIHWSACAVRSGPTQDRSTVFYNPFRKVWVYSIRWWSDLGRIRLYHEGPDVLAAANWREGEPPEWIGADRLDAPRDDLKTRCELYNLDCVAYESLLLGLFSLWRGQPHDRPKPNEICLGYSRDGFHWSRPVRTAFLPVSERHGDWNWGNVQSAGGCCLVMGDELWFYVSGRAGVKGKPNSGVSCTGLATLRRDGFASMDAGSARGTLTTRPVRFSGKFLFVNVDAPHGELRAEVLDADGKPVPHFTANDGLPVTCDKTLQPVTWRSSPDLAALAGRPVRFRFHLRNGRLYSFWVSPDASGASHGYVAAGGPGFTGPTDTVGAAALLETP